MNINLDEAINTMKMSYERFIGSGYYYVLFLLLFIYLIIRLKKEEKNFKTFFILYPIIIVVIIINPIFYHISVKFIDIDVYWRTFWCLPLGITIAYGFTKIVKSIKNKRIRNIEIIVIIIAIALSGKFIYTKEFFQMSSNAYKIPDMAYDIISEISKDNEEFKKVAGPEEIMVYMRQLDGNVLTEDYRYIGEYPEMLIISKINKGLVSIYVWECIKNECNYIVIENAIPTDAKLEDYGYSKVKTNDKYTLYKLIGE